MKIVIISNESMYDPITIMTQEPAKIALLSEADENDPNTIPIDGKHYHVDYMEFQDNPTVKEKDMVESIIKTAQLYFYENEKNRLEEEIRKSKTLIKETHEKLTHKLTQLNDIKRRLK